MNPIDKKIIKLGEALQKPGEKVVLCHGHFNIIHPGHIRYLDFSSQQGTKLVVSVLGDNYFLYSEQKQHFMEEMGDQRSRDALKAAITDAYGSELELQVISPHEADISGDPNEKIDVSRYDQNNNRARTVSQESAMVRAAMAMGATVMAEEGTDSIKDSEKTTD